MNGLNNFGKTDRKYSLAPTEDLVIFWRSKVRVTPWFEYVVAKGCSLLPDYSGHLFGLSEWLTRSVFKKLSRWWFDSSVGIVCLQVQEIIDISLAICSSCLE